MNGLLVLDEMGTWLNSRSWNDKTRLAILNWLFLSRKSHWDVILLAQSFDMIDTQVQQNACDFLVEATRLDQSNVPFFGPIIKYLGFSPKLPQVHNYAVHKGISLAADVDETWSVRWQDCGNAYDTNQEFKSGMEALNGTLVDMRATSTNLPVNYLTRHVFIQRLENQIQALRDLKPINTEIEVLPVAKKSTTPKQVTYMQIAFLGIGLVVFLIWRYSSTGFSLPKAQEAATNVAVPVQNAHSNPPAANPSNSDNSPKLEKSDTSDFVAMQTNEFIEYLLKTYRPRLSTTAYSPEIGIVGTVDFYQDYELVESYSTKELHALGVVLVRKPYGVDLIYQGKAFIVSSWKIPGKPEQEKPSNAEPVTVSKNEKGGLLGGILN